MRGLRLEVFGSADRVAEGTVVTDLTALEEARLAAYEQGYAAGWDDAATATTDEHSRLKLDLARNLQALGFTYHEARLHVLRGVEPLLQDIVTRLLPEMARAALAPLVLESLMPLAERMADTPVTLVISPAARAAAESLIDRTCSLPLTLLEEPSLGEGQAYLRLGDSETRIDLDRAIADITAALRGFYDLTEKERKHG
ncbi:flagellar biosynthesis protein [Fertoebacter nigrum]|uniref:Flagellar biosynthesis protein n=1 Tax=Fertoeibacter niger TaxID=2656921 RepID=A0A8X8H1S4_9RHOB|nr:flagellar biosynthesis protein [Fertoeibacter niger]NUB44597.1 flagellar biosynthesis protein [Fertoeibacter niger]